MVTLGAIVYEDDADMRNLVDRLLKQDDSSQIKTSPLREEKQKVVPKSHQTPLPTASGKDISTLKEFGDKIGQLPWYDDNAIRTEPPLFETILRFNRREFRGEGKSKKGARQVAAHQACKKFRLVVGH